MVKFLRSKGTLLGTAIFLIFILLYKFSSFLLEVFFIILAIAALIFFSPIKEKLKYAGK